MKTQFNVSVNRELLQKFKGKCFLEGVRMNAVIETMMDAYLNGGAASPERVTEQPKRKPEVENE